MSLPTSKPPLISHTKARNLAEGTLPGPPTNLRVTNSTSTSVKFSWTPPANVGVSEITGYLIEAGLEDSGGWTIINARYTGTEFTL
jgi:hypothetical protein